MSKPPRTDTERLEAMMQNEWRVHVNRTAEPDSRFSLTDTFGNDLASGSSGRAVIDDAIDQVAAALASLSTFEGSEGW